MVELPNYELAAEAAQMLIGQLAARDRPRQTLQLRSARTIWHSCGCGLRAKVV